MRCRHLENVLGVNSFVLTDYWEADLIAVGISNPANPHRLASSDGEKKAFLDVKREQFNFYEVIQPSLKAGLVFGCTRFCL